MHVGNLSDAEAFTTLDGSTIREVAGRVSLPSQKQSLAEATLGPGAATTAHHHVEAEELYFLLEGTGTMLLGDEERAVGPGDCVVIPPGQLHQLVNTGEGTLRLLCCCSPPYRHEDTVLVDA